MEKKSIKIGLLTQAKLWSAGLISMLTEATFTNTKETLNGREVPEKFDANFITEVFFPYEWNKKLFSSINTGRCYDWAYIAYCLWPNVSLWTTECHAWV